MIIIVGHQAAIEKIEILATGVGGRLLHVYGPERASAQERSWDG